MSYQAGAYIMAQVDGIRIVALVYCIVAFIVWKRQFNKKKANDA